MIYLGEEQEILENEVLSNWSYCAKCEHRKQEIRHEHGFFHALDYCGIHEENRYKSTPPRRRFYVFPTMREKGWYIPKACRYYTEIMMDNLNSDGKKEDSSKKD